MPVDRARKTGASPIGALCPFPRAAAFGLWVYSFFGYPSELAFWPVRCKLGNQLGEETFPWEERLLAWTRGDRSRSVPLEV